MKVHYIISCFSLLVSVFASDFVLAEKRQKRQLELEFLGLLDDDEREDSHKFADISNIDGPVDGLRQKMKEKLLGEFSSFFPSIGYDAQLSYVSLESLLKLQALVNESILGGEYLDFADAESIYDSFIVENSQNQQETSANGHKKRVEILEQVLFKYAMLRTILAFYEGVGIRRLHKTHPEIFELLKEYPGYKLANLLQIIRNIEDPSVAKASLLSQRFLANCVLHGPFDQGTTVREMLASIEGVQDVAV